MKIKNLGTILGITLVIYFIYHAINGERGIIALIKLQSKYDKVQEKLESTRAERLNLEHKVNLLKPKSLDLDLLEERAKKVLSYSKDNELIFYYDSDDEKNKK